MLSSKFKIVDVDLQTNVLVLGMFTWITQANHWFACLLRILDRVLRLFQVDDPFDIESICMTLNGLNRLMSISFVSSMLCR